jgi:uncharacterized phage protein gp47/JayE
LKKQLKTALELSADNQVLSDNMTESWAPSVIAAWKATLHAYRKDNTKPNLFEDPAPGEELISICFVPRLTRLAAMTPAQLRAVLDKEELDDRSAGRLYPLDVTPGSFLQQALDIESEQ